MLGAAWFRRQAQRRFVICRVGLRVHTERFGLSEDRGKPKPFMVSDKHWEWSSMPGYKTDWKALGGIKKGEKRNSRAQECLGCELSFSFLSPLFFFLPFPSSSSFVGKPSLSTNPLDSEVLMWQEAVRARSLFRLYCQRGQWCPFKRVHHFPRQDYVQSPDHC